MVTINISNKTSYVLVGVLALVIFASVVIALNSGDYLVHGHDAGEIQGSLDGGFSCKIISGRIDSDGTTLSGEGFTSSREATGLYHIEFNESFSEIPSVVISALNTEGTAGSITSQMIYALEASGFNVELSLYNVGVKNRKFNFIAIGDC